mgnify:FL=1|jgi:hypothetical protein
MNQTELQKKREDLEKKLDRLEDTHSGKSWVSESSYRDSRKAIHDVYLQLFEVAEELGDPIPVRF